MKLKAILINHLFLFGIFSAKGQSSAVNPSLLKGSWTAGWITHPDAPQREYGIYHFRKNFTLSVVPSSFVINVSADNRYRLFVNGQPVCSGPARGDLFNWYFETIDIASYLKAGENTIAAQVWNMGILAPVAQISNQTAFLVQGNTSAEEIVNTNSSWKVLQNKSYTPCSLDNEEKLQSYMAVGPGDQVNGSQYPWNWEKPGYNDTSWKNAAEIVKPSPVGYGTDNRWTLAPRSIPLFEEHLMRFPVIRRSTLPVIDQGLITGKNSLTIPAHQTVSILLDATVNTAAYPELLVSKGKGAQIKMTYAEALFDEHGNKGNRNDISGKEIKGNYDVFIPDGGEHRKFRPLWFRAYRYLQLDITTGEEPLLLNDIYSMKTGYPLALNASFTSNDPELQEIFKIGWHTAELCAGETYYDCPYYEQLQYTGDTRIQALISLYCSGDDRLVRKAILDFYHSRTPEGLTQGRYPSNRLQIIPPYSLFWVSMIYDYWMHRQDDAFVKQFLPAINEVLEWYKARVDPKKKMLGPLTWWNFVDWDNFNGSSAPGTATGNSSIVTLQYAYTLNQAADLYRAFDHPGQAVDCKLLARELNDHTFLYCYNPEKGLIADTPEQKTYSQHAGIWAILSGAVPADEIKQFMKKVLEDKSIGQVTFFYRFYLAQALKKADMADQYSKELKPWKDMVKLGLTTFAEKPEPSRSDCHAWSASPNYDFLATVCGIVPETPGFKSVLIKPALGDLEVVSATMPHPLGKIYVRLERMGKNGINAEISLPEGLSGTFIWGVRAIKISGGLPSSISITNLN